jgi:hypothetical protein
MIDLINDGRFSTLLAFSLGCGSDAVHLLIGHVFLVLLHNDRPSFWCKGGPEQVHLEEAHHAGILHLQECPEHMIRDIAVYIVSPLSS